MVILTIFLFFLAAFLPALIWLLFFLREDIHPEPKKMILYVFCLGGLASVPTLLIQIFFQKLTVALPLSELVLIVGLALFEEIFKFLAAYVAVRKNPAFDEPIDAMVYMITAALGFATIENIFITGNSLDAANVFATSNALTVLSVRFVGATMLHALTSGLLGYYWAKGLLRKSPKSFLTPAVLLVTLIHAFFNYVVLLFQDFNLIFPSIFLVFIAFFVFIDFEKLRSVKDAL
ncbi:MAG: Membrane protein [Candidatus Jorgensenbacteria bacterium GW2011_GWA1_48_11]|uniref:Protease PrsW n=1 Tax=Candidatus Jorgensenbacteria bacterium GW2011_GWA1_48_11 TaxID=1618660 RepID=A0A0G1UBY5_9BACT|nr:MAG: Membrane protein [Candidatus Jorgensenbacteria bacterium GW2011_GWA1_48_11]KKW12124.1 MAG: Membrane protein [Candidatus Jorgensenbacteria bacterium GW2011_GWB1_49_9]